MGEAGRGVRWYFEQKEWKRESPAEYVRRVLGAIASCWKLRRRVVREWSNTREGKEGLVGDLHGA